MWDHEGDGDYKMMGELTMGRMYIYTEQLSDELWLQIQLNEIIWIIVKWWMIMICKMTWIFGLLLNDEWLWFVRWHEYLNCYWLMYDNVFCVCIMVICDVYHITNIIELKTLIDDLTTIVEFKFSKFGLFFNK